MLVALLAGCAAAHQLTLPGTSWSIVHLDGADLDPPFPTLRLDADGETAMLWAECGAVALVWAWDTDGSALSFAPANGESSCGQSDEGRRLLDGLRGVEEWMVEGDDAITMRGSRELRLERIVASGG